MLFNFKTPRTKNTTTEWSDSVWRMFIDDKLYVSNGGVYNWDSDEEAWESFFHSDYWETVERYIDDCQRYFGKKGDDDWRDDFSEKILEKLNIILKEYKNIE